MLPLQAPVAPSAMARENTGEWRTKHDNEINWHKDEHHNHPYHHIQRENDHCGNDCTDEAQRESHNRRAPRPIRSMAAQARYARAQPVLSPGECGASLRGRKNNERGDRHVNQADCGDDRDVSQCDDEVWYFSPSEPVIYIEPLAHQAWHPPAGVRKKREQNEGM